MLRSYISAVQHDAGLDIQEPNTDSLFTGLPCLQEPVPNIKACPAPTNLLEWHYVLEGVKGTPYEGGVYHGCVAMRAAC